MYIESLNLLDGAGVDPGLSVLPSSLSWLEVGQDLCSRSLAQSE